MQKDQAEPAGNVEEKQMKIIGVTGGVGAGKSTVLEILEKNYNAYVIQADQVGHRVMEPGACCYKPVIELFGEQVVKNDKTIDRKMISDVVFAKADMRKALNGIIHPAVKQIIQKKLEEKRQEGCPLFVVEAALLLEDHYDAFCDDVWYIYTEEAIRVHRLMVTRGYSMQKAQEIIASQAQDAYFRAHADLVIDNSGNFADTCRQIRQGINL